MAEDNATMTDVRVPASSSIALPSSDTHFWWRIVLTLLRLGLGAIFLWAGIPKIMKTSEFLAEIHQYGLVAPTLAFVAAITLPWLEFLLGTCLICNLAIQGALAVSSTLLACYIVIQWSAWHHGLQIDCGCGFSSRPEIVSPFTIGRSGILLVISLVAYGIAVFLQSEATKLRRNLFMTHQIQGSPAPEKR